MLIVSVNLGQIKPKLRAHLFSEGIVQMLDLRTISDGSVGAHGDFILFLQGVFLFKESGIDERVRSFFSHGKGMAWWNVFRFGRVVKRFIINEHV